MKLKAEVKGRIKAAVINRDEILRVRQKVNLAVLDKVIPSGENLRDLGIRLERDTAITFADLAPGYNWAHPCRVYLHDADTGEQYDQIDASFPPKNLIHNAENIDHFHTPIRLLDTAALRVGRPIGITPRTNVLSNHPGNRYAILYSGESDNRHLNDLEFLYRVLIDVYDFNAANIFVLNHDGTVNYNGAPNPIGNWPGDNTAYRIVVNGAGTRAGFQATITTLAAQIQPEDLLLIHTNNHGAGPCDIGPNGVALTDYCLCAYDATSWATYMVNDFVTDLGGLPSFEVLLVMMEQCRSGGFINPIINANLANWTHMVTAVDQDDYSLGGANFDPFAEDWIAALNGQYADGTALSQAVDTTNDGRVSSAEAYTYADAVCSFNGSLVQMCGTDELRLGDTPQSSASPTGCDDTIFLGLPDHDLFLRDNLQDHGREPLVGGGISSSPDIIVYNQELLDPNATLLSTAAQDSNQLGEPVEAGQSNFIYVRVHNRGTQATAGNVTVYWCKPSVLPAPNSWNLIGSTNVPAVPPGEVVVPDPIEWKEADIPGEGHYCFVGIVDSGNDPAPDKSAIQSTGQFYAFIRASNNATWKNFDVVDVFANSISNMSFHIQGWPRKRLTADLIVDLSEVPENFEVKLRILRRLSESTTLLNMKLDQQTSTYQKLNVKAGKQGEMREMKLKPSDDTVASLQITVPPGVADGVYRISVAQVVDGREMGRVTRLLAVGEHPYLGNRRSREIHIPSCKWAKVMSPRNRVAYKDLERAIKHGYNGCRFCLTEYDTD